MKRLLLILSLLFTTPVYGAVQADMGWTSAIDAIWTDLKDTSHSTYTTLLTNLDNQSCEYNNQGLSYAVGYKVSGDTSYCDRAYSVSWCGEGLVAGSGTANGVRDCFVENAVAYSFCADVVDAGTKADWETDLDAVVGWVTGPNGPRPSDSDELIGYYFGCMVYDIAKDGVINQCVNNQKTGGTFGGITVDGTTCYGPEGKVRNCVNNLFTNYSGGGSWVETSYYNKNTLWYAILGSHVINDWCNDVGVGTAVCSSADMFPEITALYDDFALSWYQRTTPDYSENFDWGDIKSPRTHEKFRATQIYAALAALNNNDENMWHLYDEIGDDCGVRMGWTLFANPKATRAKDSGQSAHNADEMGFAYWHEGWTANDTFFASRQSANPLVDHYQNVMEGFEVWKDGGWITSARKHNYDQEYTEHAYTNGLLLFGGFSGMREAKGQVNYEAGSDYMYHSGVSSGSFVNEGDEVGFPPFVDEDSNQKLFRHNADETDTVFLYNRVKACKPSSLLCMSAGARAALEARSRENYERALAGTEPPTENADSWRHIYVLNTDAAPSKSGNKFSWTDVDTTTAVEFYSFMEYTDNETVNMSTVSYYNNPYQFDGYHNASEKTGYQLRLELDTANGYTLYPILNILHIGGAGGYTEITEASGEEVQGAMVETSSEWIVGLFSAEDDITTTWEGGLTGNRVDYDPNRFTKAASMMEFKDGSTVYFTIDNTNPVEVFVMGLDTDLDWTFKLDDGAQACTVSSAGICNFTINPGVAKEYKLEWNAGDETTCAEACSQCGEEDCEVDGPTCYWHNNDGDTGFKCNAEKADSVMCETDWEYCRDITLCEDNNWCWLVDACVESCDDPPPSFELTIYAAEDTYLDEDNNDTNRDTGEIKVRSSSTSSGEVIVDPSFYTLGGTDSGDLSATADRLTHSALNDNGNAYAIRDYGASYFGEFDIDFTVRVNIQQSASHVGYLCISDTENVDMSGMNTANDGICFGFKRDGTDGWFLKEYSADNIDVVAGVAYQTRYINLTRSSTTCTANVYTDSGRTTHASGSPITATCSAGNERYMYLAASNGSDGWASSAGTGYIEDITINQADSGGSPTGTDFAGVLEFDISSIPDTAIINNVLLNFTWCADSDGETGTIYAYTGLRNFVEDEATWDIYSTGNNWGTSGATAGTDMTGNAGTSTGAIASFSILGAEDTDDESVFTTLGGLTTLVSDNLDGSIYIHVYEVPTATASLLTMCDSENATTTKRPYLYIYYTDDSPIEPPTSRRSIGSGKIVGRWGG